MANIREIILKEFRSHKKDIEKDIEDNWREKK